MPWFFHHACKQLFPTGRRVSFFTCMSIVGVALGVCVLIIVQSVMNGFGEGIRSRIVETYGDIRIQSPYLIDDWGANFAEVAAFPEVLALAPYAEGVVLLQYGNKPEFPGIRGIDPVAEERVLPIRQFITSGDLDEFDDEGIFMGDGLAASLGVVPGDRVEVFTPLMLERLKEDEVLLPREFSVIGLFRTRSPTVDGRMIICTLRVLQELYGLGDAVHGVVLRLRPGVDADVFAERLESDFLEPGMRAVSWRASSRDFLFVIEQEKRIISFIIIFIILVAAFSIAIALTMAVLRKTREIGLLVAMGARPLEVACSYCWQGFLIGAVGTVLGVCMALLALYYRGPILNVYMSLSGSGAGFLGVYDVYKIPVHYLASDFVMVAVFAVLISTLAGLVPALRAARLKPADALRSES
jgi:lipoprotein-releasing system permease protein